MKLGISKFTTISLILLGTSFVSCMKKEEAVNKASDLVNSPMGYWTTEDSKLGQIGWKINNDDFKKCIVALDTKIKEETGIVHIDNNRVKYTYTGSHDEFTATYHSDDNTLTEDQALRLKYVRADANKINELNAKGCHL